MESNKGMSLSLPPLLASSISPVSSPKLLSSKKKVKKTGKGKRKTHASFLVSTSAFRGNLDCLRATLKNMPGWREEIRAKQLDRCCIMWLGKDIDQMRYGGSMDMSMLTREGQFGSRIEGMRELSTKDATVECIERLRSLFPADPSLFAFAPRSWILPLEGEVFARVLRKNAKKKGGRKDTFIVKPSAGSEGNGIFLAQGLDDVPSGVLENNCNRRRFVAQEYLASPMTLDGYKFDLRLYVLVTSVDPLRCYLFEEGLVRLCSEKYRFPEKKNLRDAYAHLTNYTLNKKNHENYKHTFAPAGQEDEENEADNEQVRGIFGSKRKLSDVLPVLEDKSKGIFEVEAFWKATKDLVAKTLIAYQPMLAINYRVTFPRSRGQHVCTGEGKAAKQTPRKPKMGHPSKHHRNLSSQIKCNAKPPCSEAIEDSEKPESSTEETKRREDDDSFRCFHILGFDVLLSDSGRSVHLLEVNSNPSLLITHEIEPEDQNDHTIPKGIAGRRVQRATTSRKALSVPSPIDEEIKTGVVSGALRLVTSRDESVAASTGFLPVLTSATEAIYHDIMVLDRVRRAFEACASRTSFQRNNGCISNQDFRRVAAIFGVKHADADILFVRLVSRQEGGYNNRTMELKTFVAALEALAHHPDALVAFRRIVEKEIDRRLVIEAAVELVLAEVSSK